MKVSIVLFVISVLAPVVVLEAVEPSPSPTPASQIAYLYEPTDGVIADVIPFRWQGRFHVMHLQLKPRQKGWDWAQLVTQDFTTFDHKGVAIAGDGTDEAHDRDIFTGSVFEKDGVLHAFYCGHNDLLAKQKQPDQLMLLATSTDGIVWTKDDTFRLSPEGDARYRWPGAFRDGFVFHNSERDEYGMLVTATPVDAPMGGLAYASSADLKTWTLGVRIPPEVEKSFGPAEAVQLPDHPWWGKVASGGVRAGQGPVAFQLGKLPPRCLLRAELTLPPTGRAGFWFGGIQEGKEGFRLFVDVGARLVAWDRNEQPLGSNPERERNYRPLRIAPGDRVTLKVVLDGNAAVACVNDDVCLSTRMYDRREDTFGIWSDTVGSEFSNVVLQAEGTAR